MCAGHHRRKIFNYKNTKGRSEGVTDGVHICFQRFAPGHRLPLGRGPKKVFLGEREKTAGFAIGTEPIDIIPEESSSSPYTHIEPCKPCMSHWIREFLHEDLCNRTCGFGLNAPAPYKRRGGETPDKWPYRRIHFIDTAPMIAVARGSTNRFSQPGNEGSDHRV